MAGDDRLTALCEQPVKSLTGIDFIQIVDPKVQLKLHIYFIVDPEDLENPPSQKFSELPIDVGQIEIVSTLGERASAEIFIESVINSVGVDGRHILEVTVRQPGNFSLYQFTIDDERIDRFFDSVAFSFKQGCPSRFDCKPPPLECPLEESVDFPVDYLARDFVSLRNALLDFAAQRYPTWTEKIEADAGVMLVEVMSALGDEQAYIQDRYSREAYIESASQRRSLARHGRLVDYPIHYGLTADTVLELRVKSDVSFRGGTFLDAGKRVWASGDGKNPIPFELGEGMHDAGRADREPRQFWVQAAWNQMQVHVPDDASACLLVGSTELYIRGHFPSGIEVPVDAVTRNFWNGRWMLLKTTPENAAEIPKRHLIRIFDIEQTLDPLCLDDGGSPMEITRIRWEESQALPFEMCLAEMTVHGNIVPATAGKTIEEHFKILDGSSIAMGSSGVMPAAVEREGALNETDCERSTTILYSLRKAELQGLGWLGEIRNAIPECELEEVNPGDVTSFSPAKHWRWRSTLLNSRSYQDDYTLESGTYRRVIGFDRTGETIVHQDYASDSGFTIRMGDGDFGRIPVNGTTFRVRYRSGPGTLANIPADSIAYLRNPIDEDEADLETVLDAVSNPFPVTHGVDPEDKDVFKQLAPEAFRALALRAVRAEDYQEISERLPWVQRAGAQFRWTGSWLSAFVTPDPIGEFELSDKRRSELENLINCVRLAGREAFVKDPVYIDVDLEIGICIEPSAYAGQVRERVILALTGKRGVRPIRGFFDADNFTFGSPLLRADLEAAIQAVPGVKAVDGLHIHARGVTELRPFNEWVFGVADDEIIRLQNDRRFPGRGSLRIEIPPEVRA